ncbi:MAG: restriction endonuclease subunit S [Candidatus Nitrotoga sp.]
MALSRKPIEIVNQGNHQLLTKASHWERVPLSDVAVVQNGFAFKSELFTHSGGKPLIRIRDIEDGWTENFYSDEFLVRKGDILIGMDGDFNAAIWQGVDGLLNQRVCRLIPISKNFSDKFLFGYVVIRAYSEIQRSEDMHCQVRIPV